MKKYLSILMISLALSSPLLGMRGYQGSGKDPEGRIIKAQVEGLMQFITITSVDGKSELEMFYVTSFQTGIGALGGEVKNGTAFTRADIKPEWKKCMAWLAARAQQ